MDRSKFLIASSADAGRAASNGTVSKGKTAAKKAGAVAGAGAHKGPRKGPQSAKYLDPKSGATWSGRGPAPAWLAAAKDRTRFLIGGAGVVAPEAGAVSKASKPKAAGKSGAVAKKAAAEKVVARKVASKKTPAVKSVAAKSDTPPVPNVPTELSA